MTVSIVLGAAALMAGVVLLSVDRLDDLRVGYELAPKGDLQISPAASPRGVPSYDPVYNAGERPCFLVVEKTTPGVSILARVLVPCDTGSSQVDHLASVSPDALPTDP